MGKRKHSFKPNYKAESYKFHLGLLKEDRIYQWKQKQPIKRLTLNGHYYETKGVKESVSCNLRKNGSRPDDNGKDTRTIKEIFGRTVKGGEW
tara:strand:- start:52 stop:327 length:276 start_codon:yes stop_codon:yes gene_type:complete